VGEYDDSDVDPAAAVHLLLVLAQLAAARLPAATLNAVGTGGVATPAARGWLLAAAATATAVPGTPLAVAATASPRHATVLPATHWSASAAVASTAGPDVAAGGVGATAIAEGQLSSIRAAAVASSAAARMARGAVAAAGDHSLSSAAEGGGAVTPCRGGGPVLLAS